jgi:2,3-diaminopropionate biosynthesis protein SbnA/2,3-diaminopropionate biosynthesis protein SbnB
MRHDGGLRLLRGDDVAAFLEGQEARIGDVVREAYLAHADAKTTLPHSCFLRFPDRSQERIIALPAYLGGARDAAGVKWVASFPRNLDLGCDRASAVIILNSTATGRPYAVVEGSLISAKRTAASAAAAAAVLHAQSPPDALGVIGCGPINAEIVRFVAAHWPSLRRLVVFDIDAARAETFCQEQTAQYGLACIVTPRLEDVLAGASLVSFATTAGTPHVSDLSMCPPGAVILHVSLRDIAPRALLEADNIADDVDHVCREKTSVHLAEQIVGHRTFMRTTLGEILAGRAPARAHPERVAIFSPFGLGILDVALAAWVVQRAEEEDRGLHIPGFLPAARSTTPAVSPRPRPAARSRAEHRAPPGGILSAVGDTPLVSLDKAFAGAPFRVFAKLEGLNPGGSIKDRAAKAMLLAAINRGDVRRGTTIIESTSGNMGIGLAQACRYLGLRFICVVDAKTTAQNLALLRVHGADVEMVEHPDPITGDFLSMRLRRVQELMAKTPDSYWPNQYANVDNARAHYRTMAEIAEALEGRVDHVFCPTSTCGTIRGCSDYLAEHGLSTRVWAVDAVGSVIFGSPPAKRLLPGHGASRLPELLRRDQISDCIHVSDLDCIVGCRHLLRTEAMLVGGSSGGVAMAITLHQERIRPGAICVAIFPDRGDRYLDTIYSDEWAYSHFGELFSVLDREHVGGPRSMSLLDEHRASLRKAYSCAQT